ncbi:MAG: HD domain-containing protein [Ignavibacteria bacterium]|nr:HD domain-containing protein [Ignavibacteria bacterium]
MNTKQVYKTYMIPRNLQEHMLRVASLAKIILDNWIGPTIDKKAIIQACVFHDIAKPMNFDLTKQAQFGMSATEVANLDKLQRHLKTNYGDNEHHATVEICKEIGCNPTTIKIVNDLEWSYVPFLLSKTDLQSLIPIYGDMRIGPKGILTLKQRFEDLKVRTGESEHEQNGVQLENLISKNVSINLNKISNEQINQNFIELENLNFS